MQKRTYDSYVLLFYACFLLLTSSGRLDSVDPLAQLQAATALARTGSLGVKEHPLPEVDNLWHRGAGNAFYQAHDIGASLFMLPAAWVASHLSGRPTLDQIKQPTWPARFGVSLSYTLLAAAGCYFLFRFFAGLYASRTAFLLSLAFATTTILWVYAKSAYDVLGACVGVCLLLWFCGDVLSASAANRRLGVWDGAKIGAAFALACAFRFSLTPFLGVGVAGVLFLLWRARKKWTVTAGACLAVVAGLAPSIFYNYVRTAAPLTTGATGSYTPTAYLLQGNVLNGLYGLLVSPNRGLVFFAPVFLLLLALPFVWKQAPQTARRVFACLGVTALLYTIAVALFYRWNAIGGWGPRYLVPILPILFVGVAAVLVAGWRRHKRLFLALLLVSAALNGVPVLVDYNLAARGDANVASPQARYPRQQWAAWTGLSHGLRGAPPSGLPVTPAEAADPVRRVRAAFPDFWTVRLIKYSPAGAAVGASGALLLLLGALWSLAKILARAPD